jgi:two-component system cell cycle sensor histidine kinase/response regulator CckA
MAQLPILLVDDEPQVRSFVKTVLLRQGFRVVEAEDGLAAFSFILDFHGQFSLVVSDIGVPHLDGVKLSRWVREQFPSLPVLLLSGGSDPDNYSEGSAFLPEPFCASQLIGAVRGLLSTS